MYKYWLLTVVFVFMLLASTTIVQSASAQIGSSPSGMLVQVCESKSNIILKRSTQLGEMAATIEQKYTILWEGAQAFYAKKNLAVANYTELVTGTGAKRKAIAPLLAIAKADVSNFSCRRENPAGQLKKYKDDMQVVIAALHEYRGAIKMLIEAIRQAHATTITPTVTL